MAASRNRGNRMACGVVLAFAATCGLDADAASPGTESATERVASPAHAPKAAHRKGTSDGRQDGTASFYSRHLSGRKTASGEPYDPNAMTAAHRTLPLGTKVRVVNPKNDRSVVVTVNDRGPAPKNRMIDVSSAAASELGMTKAGVTKVETEVVGKSGAVGR